MAGTLMIRAAPLRSVGEPAWAQVDGREGRGAGQGA